MRVSKTKKALDEILSMYFSMLAKKTHEKNPRPKEFYSNMAKTRWAKNKGKTTCDEQSDSLQ